ncbi:MAG TPA: hypothetical protein VKI19_14190 [Acidimicrobiales bacterium]|nr:hypothetical protein [Acidimicrobiales bacterium]
MGIFSTAGGGPSRLLAALSVGLLVVGAGAAVGMGTSSSQHGAVGGSATTAPTVVPGPGAAGGGSTATVAGSTTTTATTRPQARSGTASGAVSGAGGRASGSPGPATTTLPGGSVPGGGSTSPTTAASGPEPALPRTGTYTYSTSGSQTLFSSTSDYPPKTTIQVSRDACGVAAKWTSSPGNTTTIVECPVAGGIRVVSESSTVDENGYRNSMTFDCGPDAFVPTSGTPGQTWTWSCHASNGETTSQVVKLIGPATMTVAGAAVATEHVQIVATLSGPQKGTVHSDYWLASDATPVHEVASITASQYGITYKSNYTLQLDSLQPS